MKKKMTLFLFLFCFYLNAQSGFTDYFTIGSTKNKVLQVQGEPTSVSNTGPYSTFSYGYSTVTFKNGLVDGYNNNSGNLKVKMNTSISDNNTKKKNVQKKKKTNTLISKKVKQVNNKVKYIYFTYLTTTPSIEVDYSGKMLPTEYQYSKMYSISGYTFELEQSLEFCLTKDYKERTGEKATLISHEFDDRQLLLLHWNDEKGRLFNSSLCYYLMQYGISEQ